MGFLEGCKHNFALSSDNLIIAGMVVLRPSSSEGGQYGMGRLSPSLCLLSIEGVSVTRFFKETSPSTPDVYLFGDISDVLPMVPLHTFEAFYNTVSDLWLAVSVSS